MPNEYVCDICGKPFRSERSLNEHKTKVHYTEKKFKCPYCGKGFSGRGALNTHIRLAHFEDEIRKAVEEALTGSKVQTNGEVKMPELNESYIDKLLSTQREALEGKVEIVKRDIEREIDRVRQETKESFSKEVDRLSRGFEDLARSLEEIRNTISTISKTVEESTNGQKSLEKQLGEQMNKISEMMSKYPTKEEVKDLINECVSDPSSPACSIITSMVSDVVGKKEEEKEEKKEEEKIYLDHKTWDEAFECPECIEGFAKGFAKSPERMSEFLKKLSEKDRETFAKVISEILPKKSSFF